MISEVLKIKGMLSASKIVREGRLEKVSLLGRLPSGQKIYEGKNGYFSDDFSIGIDLITVGFYMEKEFSKTKINVEQVKKALDYGKSDLIEGARSPRGRLFSFYLVRTNDGLNVEIHRPENNS